MADVLVDTDVASFFLKRDTRAAKYERHLRGHKLYLCFMSVAELYRWAFAHNWGEGRWRGLREHIRTYGVFAYDEPTCLVWARISHAARRAGRRMEIGDAWIAATAIRHRLPLVTHNASDDHTVEALQIITEANAK